MDKHMTITEELKAIQAGELPCSDNRRASLVTYCQRWSKAMEDLINSDGPKGLIAGYLPMMRKKSPFFPASSPGRRPSREVPNEFPIVAQLWPWHLHR